jgi:hypothetical protein
MDVVALAIMDVDDSHKSSLVQSQLMGKFMVQKESKCNLTSPLKTKKTKLIFIMGSLQKTIQRRRSTQRHKVIETTPLLLTTTITTTKKREALKKCVY